MKLGSLDEDDDDHDADSEVQVSLLTRIRETGFAQVTRVWDKSVSISLNTKSQ